MIQLRDWRGAANARRCDVEDPRQHDDDRESEDDQDNQRHHHPVRQAERGKRNFAELQKDECDDRIRRNLRVNTAAAEFSQQPGKEILGGLVHLNGNAVSALISFKMMLERTCDTPGSLNMNSSRKRL